MYEYFNGDYIHGPDVYLDDYYMDERWWYINGAPEYMISDHGRVWTSGDIRHKPHILSPYSNDKYGHQVVDLYYKGRRTHKYVHKLVAEAFLPNPHGYNEVRHLDGDPTNNHYSNLKWGTHSDNMRDAMEHGTFHYFTPEEDELALRVLRTPVKAVNIKTGEEFVFKSQAEAARILNLYQPNIRHVLSGWYKQTGGYKFEYLKERWDYND